jgi:4-amino-4-deoxy-L-arabinose transferase-like glycosyltransferase
MKAERINYSAYFPWNQFKKNHLILLFIPLVLSSFTHLWNLSQFPSFHPDEGVYIKRALNILEGNGPHDNTASFDHSQDSTSSFDHPYFGQIFLAAFLGLIGFPDSINPSTDVQSIETLYLIPRILMGIVAVIDTFLIYKITEKRYNRTIAIFASILFAVMPLTWFMRRIVLDSIMLPFILTSIFLALKIGPRSISKNKILLLLSGISMGIAIFTKIPAICFLPIVIYLINHSLSGIPFKKNKFSFNTEKIKLLFIWFLMPAVLIPAIWPAYAIVSDRFDELIDGVFWQGTERHEKGKSLFNIVDSFWKSDPVLLVLGLIGVIYCLLRKEFVPIIWLVPYIIFLYFIGWVTHFHLILVLPALCIAIAKLIYDLPRIIKIKKKDNIITFIIISSLCMFGLVNTTLLISTDLSYTQFYSISFIAKQIEKESHERDPLPALDDHERERDQITVISSPISSWIYKYVFDNENTFSHVRDTKPISTSNILLLVDSTYKHVISKEEGENLTQIERLKTVYNNTNVAALFKDDVSNYDRKIYPYTGLNSANIGSRTQEIRTNY